MRGCPSRAWAGHFVANVLCWRKHRTGLAPILDDDFSNILAPSRTRDLAKAARCEGRIALKRNHGLHRCRYGGMNGEKQRIGATAEHKRLATRTAADPTPFSLHGNCDIDAELPHERRVPAS